MKYVVDVMLSSVLQSITDDHICWASQETHTPVAIKTVNRNGLSQKLFENLRGEIDILKTLSHRHITRLLDLVVRCLPLMLHHPLIARMTPASMENATYILS